MATWKLGANGMMAGLAGGNGSIHAIIGLGWSLSMHVTFLLPHKEF